MALKTLEENLAETGDRTVGETATDKVMLILLGNWVLVDQVIYFLFDIHLFIHYIYLFVCFFRLFDYLFVYLFNHYLFANQ